MISRSIVIAWLLAFLGWASLGSPVLASQGSGCMPTTGTVSGLTFAQDVNAGIAALISSNSGGSAPNTDCSGAAVKGQIWLDTSATPNILKQYDGTNWLVLGFMDATNHVWTPPVGGGVATVASATTTDLWAVPQSTVTVTGTTTITALANSSAVPGTMKIVKFASALTLTHDATALVLPGAANITTAAGDYALVVATSDTNVAVASYFKADGTAVVNPGPLRAGVLTSATFDKYHGIRTITSFGGGLQAGVRFTSGAKNCYLGKSANGIYPTQFYGCATNVIDDNGSNDH